MDTGLNPTHSQIADFLTDNIISEITGYLMEDFGCPLEKALDMVYSSNVLDLLQHKEGELYVQSPSYIRIAAQGKRAASCKRNRKRK